MSSVVVDASVAVKWVIPEERREIAHALYLENQVFVPPHMLIEATQALHKRVRVTDPQIHIELNEALQAVERLVGDFQVKVEAPSQLYSQALQIADHLNHPNVYDVHYIALAELLGVNLWTDDEVLWQQTKDKYPFVKRLADYQSPSPGTL